MSSDRRRLRRGETVEVCSPSAGLGTGPRLRERPLGRCHTLDSGEETPELLVEPANTTETGVSQAARAAPPPPGTRDTHSADSCSTTPQTSPTSSTQPHPHNPSPPLLRSLLPLNGQPADNHAANEAPQSDDLHPADLHHTVPTAGGDQGDAGGTPGAGTESNHEG